MAKVTFDGPNKQIIVNAQESQIDVKVDIYSDWKEWVQVGDNAKYLAALRTIGGDPIGAGRFAGDLYFLINGWTVVVGHEVDFVGALFSDDFPSPFTVLAGGRVTSTVSNLVQAIEIPALTEQQIGQIVDAVWSATDALTRSKYLSLQ